MRTGNLWVANVEEAESEDDLHKMEKDQINEKIAEGLREGHFCRFYIGDFGFGLLLKGEFLE